MWSKVGSGWIATPGPSGRPRRPPARPPTCASDQQHVGVLAVDDDSGRRRPASSRLARSAVTATPSSRPARRASPVSATVAMRVPAAMPGSSRVFAASSPSARSSSAASTPMASSGEQSSAAPASSITRFQLHRAGADAAAFLVDRSGRRRPSRPAGARAPDRSPRSVSMVRRTSASAPWSASRRRHRIAERDPFLRRQMSQPRLPSFPKGLDPCRGGSPTRAPRARGPGQDLRKAEFAGPYWLGSSGSNAMRDDTDFAGKAVLVVGGSSGIGNGIAHAFKDRGAKVAVWGTRPKAEDYRADEGSDLSGLAYAQVDVGDPGAIEAAAEPFDTLDVLVLCQGWVVYRRGEFERPGWDRVMAVNLDSLMGCARKFHDQLAAAKGSLIIVSFDFRPEGQHRQSGLCRLQSRSDQPYQNPGPSLGGGRYPGQRPGARPRRHQAHQGHHRRTRTPRRGHRPHSRRPHGRTSRHGRGGDLPRLAAGRLCHWAHPDRRWRIVALKGLCPSKRQGSHGTDQRVER